MNTRFLLLLALSISSIVGVWLLGQIPLEEDTSNDVELLPRLPIGKKLVRPVVKNVDFSPLWNKEMPLLDCFQYAVEEFANPTTSRQQLLESFQSFLELDPPEDVRRIAADVIAVLEVMVAEDEEEAKQPKKNAAEMTLEERIEQLIFQLRNQAEETSLRTVFSRSWPSPEPVYVLRDRFAGRWVPEVQTPAEALVDVGYAAVPYLIEAMNDHRFARAVGKNRGDFCHEILRVRECARQILEEICATNLYDQAKAQEWWQEFQTKGECFCLQKATVTGVNTVAAERLVKRYPKNACGALMQGIAAARGDWHRSRLIELAGELDDQDIPDMLRNELAGSFFHSRTTAAKILFVKGFEEGFEALMAEWTRVEGKPSHLVHLDDLVRYLVKTGREEAILALGRNWGMRSATVRRLILDSLHRHRTDFRDKPFPGNVARAIENVLLEALTDRTEAEWHRYSVYVLDGKPRKKVTARHCDLAAATLAELRNQPSLFNIHAVEAERDRLIEGMKTDRSK